MLACDGIGGLPGPGPAAVGGVSLVVEPGEVVAVLGQPPEAAGMLLRACAGLWRPVQGGIRVHGRPPTPGWVRGRIGYVRSGLVGPVELTVAEWLDHVVAQRGGPRAARRVRVQAALALVGLGPDAGRRIGALDRDGAEQLAVATVAARGVPLILLDDCFRGLRTGTRRLLSGAVADLAQQGRTVLLAPHDVLTAEGLATRVVLLRAGRVLADLRMSEVQRDRVAELRLNGGALAAVPRVVARFPDAVRTGTGVAVPLTAGRSLEYVLAVMREERVAVAGSHVRFRALDDLATPEHATPEPIRAAVLG